MGGSELPPSSNAARNAVRWALLVALMAVLTVLIVLPQVVLIVGALRLEPPRALRFTLDGFT